MTSRIDIIGTNGNDGQQYEDQQKIRFTCGHNKACPPGAAINYVCEVPGCNGTALLGIAEVFPGASASHEKQPRYQDAKGEDWIDEFARTATAEEFRGAMRFTIGKYNRRMGKKDELIQEIEKMRDYCDRWLEVEKARL